MTLYGPQHRHLKLSQTGKHPFRERVKEQNFSFTLKNKGRKITEMEKLQKGEYRIKFEWAILLVVKTEK